MGQSFSRPVCVTVLLCVKLLCAGSMHLAAEIKAERVCVSVYVHACKCVCFFEE